MAAQGYEVDVKVLPCVWLQDTHPAEDNHDFHPVALWSAKQPEQLLIEGPVNIQVMFCGAWTLLCGESGC